MRALSSRPFCPCGGRRVDLRYLSAVCRYTAHPLFVSDMLYFMSYMSYSISVVPLLYKDKM